MTLQCVRCYGQIPVEANGRRPPWCPHCGTDLKPQAAQPAPAPAADSGAPAPGQPGDTAPAAPPAVDPFAPTLTGSAAEPAPVPAPHAEADTGFPVAPYELPPERSRDRPLARFVLALAISLLLLCGYLIYTK